MSGRSYAPSLGSRITWFCLTVRADPMTLFLTTRIPKSSIGLIGTATNSVSNILRHEHRQNLQVARLRTATGKIFGYMRSLLPLLPPLTYLFPKKKRACRALNWSRMQRDQLLGCIHRSIQGHHQLIEFLHMNSVLQTERCESGKNACCVCSCRTTPFALQLETRSLR